MRSIRTRLLAWLLATLAAAACVMGGLTYRSVLAESERLFDYQLRQMALSLRDQGEIASGQARALADEELDFVVQIWSVDGRSIYASQAHTSLPDRAALGFADIVVQGAVWRTYGVATRDRVIQVAQPLAIRRRLAATAALHSVAPLLVAAPLLALVVWWLAAGTLGPLRRVAAGLQARDEQSLQPLPTAGLPLEVEPLVAALNGLFRRLSASIEAQRAFVSDAAHELRSPLTALKLQLQLLRRAPDDAERATAVEALGAGIDRAARLVEQLLTLARSEPGTPLAMVDGIDLGATVRGALADTALLAESRGSSVGFVCEGLVTLRGDPGSIAMLARNLIDNALRHAPPATRVEVCVLRDAGGAALLRVDDAGPGIPPAEQARVFDRFYRRASDDAAGSGLGLAIVRSVADRHGASVVLGDAPPGGLRVTVRFPPPATAGSAAALPTLAATTRTTALPGAGPHSDSNLQGDP